MALPILTIQMVGDKELVARLNSMPESMRQALLRKVTVLTLQLERLVKNKLSDDVLHVRTGKLRASVFSEVQDNGIGVRGVVSAGRGVAYAAIHEFGGTIHIPDIYPTKAQALHFYVGGNEVFAKHVRAHDVVIPERSYMRSSLADMREIIVQQMTEAIREGGRKGGPNE